MLVNNKSLNSELSPLLEVRDLIKIYYMGDIQIPALNGVTFNVYPGDFIALMGTSGSGKTTLLNLIGGLDSITKGSIIIEGTDISKMSDKELTTVRRKRMGFIFQFFNLIPVLSAYENVELPLKVLKIPKEERKEKITKIFQELEIGDRMKNKPDQLSGGQQQRVAIARALALDPAIILADEATGNLDSKTGENIMNSLVRLNQEYNKTIIMVTHDRHIAEFASKILHMEDGKIVREEKVN
ncbi:MAG: ABC transporter ATP-binding protein [Candidatus Hermodarchaeota archaeon]